MLLKGVPYADKSSEPVIPIVENATEQNSCATERYKGAQATCYLGFSFFHLRQKTFVAAISMAAAFVFTVKNRNMKLINLESTF